MPSYCISRYTFYLDFLASEFDDRTQNALLHLKEQSEYVRVLGSYPKGGELIGPVKATLASLSSTQLNLDALVKVVSPARKSSENSLKIGIIGFGKFGQFLGRTFAKSHQVYCVDKDDMSSKAQELGCEFYPLYDLTPFGKLDLDVIIFAVSIISFEDVIRNIPADILRNKLIVDVLSVKAHAKKVMLENLPENCDILCTHPMFGPESGKFGWQSLPFLYEKVRIENFDR